MSTPLILAKRPTNFGRLGLAKVGSLSLFESRQCYYFGSLSRLLEPSIGSGTSLFPLALREFQYWELNLQSQASTETNLHISQLLQHRCSGSLQLHTLLESPLDSQLCQEQNLLNGSCSNCGPQRSTLAVLFFPHQLIICLQEDAQQVAFRWLVQHSTIHSVAMKLAWKRAGVTQDFLGSRL